MLKFSSKAVSEILHIRAKSAKYSISCTFSRARADEKIYKELEEALAELNNQGLTKIGVE